MRLRSFAANGPLDQNGRNDLGRSCMATDWNLVTLKHVEEACARYDGRKASPSHPARNTFLLFNHKRYPAKFIRGLAYKIATGSKPGDYQGGVDTVRFFQKLGLSGEYNGRPFAGIQIQSA